MPKLIRSFISIEFPQGVTEEINRIQEEISKIPFKGKMTEKENLHLTLKFLGEIEEGKIKKVKKNLEKIKFNEMNLKLGEVGVFNRRESPSIIWIRIYGKGIFELQEKIDFGMEKLGFPKEKRFMSHLTIARIKSVKEKDDFLKKIKNIQTRNIEFKVNKFRLKESKLTEKAPSYRDIGVYPIQ